MKRVLFISEFINPPYDEGIKKTVYNLYLELKKKYELKVLCRYGFIADDIHVVNTNSLFYSRKVKLIIEKFDPEVLIYLPFQSSTFASYLRIKVLAMFANKRKNILIALQPKPIKAWQQVIVKNMKPQLAITPSPALKEFWDRLGIHNQKLPLLTDLNVFKPLPNKISKANLRAKYNLPKDAFIISHMGHLNKGRNLKSLIPLQKKGYHVVIAASSSTPKDALGNAKLKNKLLKSGMIILDGYIEHIEEIYQLSDIYIFPVVEMNSSIGLPLSILEARACGIPVVTTDFGSIRDYLEDDFGSIKYSEPSKFKKAIKGFRKEIERSHESSRIIMLNNQFYEILYNLIEE